MIRPALCLPLVMMAIGAARPASAQGRADCSSPQPRSIGIALGRSLPGVELAPGVVNVDPGMSVSVGSGAQVAGRADLPLVGPLRVRLEGAAARWHVQSIRYSPGPEVRAISLTSVDRMSTKHVTALVGLRQGRAPACAHVSAGIGLYALTFRGTSVRPPVSRLRPASRCRPVRLARFNSTRRCICSEPATSLGSRTRPFRP
jgi:hypothetical protein